MIWVGIKPTAIEQNSDKKLNSACFYKHLFRHYLEKIACQSEIFKLIFDCYLNKKSPAIVLFDFCRGLCHLASIKKCYDVTFYFNDYCFTNLSVAVSVPLETEIKYIPAA